MASQQRVAEERGKKLTLAENRAAVLENEVAQLRNELDEKFAARYAFASVPFKIFKLHLAALLSYWRISLAPLQSTKQCLGQYLA